MIFTADTEEQQAVLYLAIASYQDLKKRNQGIKLTDEGATYLENVRKRLNAEGMGMVRAMRTVEVRE